MKKRNGFTLIELMITVSIIGTLSTIAIPKMVNLINSSHEGSTKGKLGALRSAIKIYSSYTEGVYPVGEDAFTANSNALEAALVPTYISTMPTCMIPLNHTASKNCNNYTTSSVHENPVCEGKWAYVGSRASTSWGTLFVECWHNDTKGTPIESW